MSANGAVAILVRSPTKAFQMSGPSRNFGSSRLPVIGRSMSMTPFRSFRSATASFSGRLTASGLFTLSPSWSWSITNFCLASSARFSTL